MLYLFFFKQKTAYEMRISDWSSDVCSSDLRDQVAVGQIALLRRRVEQHEMLDARKLIAQSLDDRQKGRVEEQHPVRGMVDDIHKLFVEQPRIDGMQHPAHSGGAVPAQDRKSTRLNSSHYCAYRMPSSA